jgi:predicted GIY-YIG superfamily endonuclease
MFHYVYVLQFDESNILYKGYTKNLKLRLEHHKRGTKGYIKNKGPF